ncbi:MAG TPA: CdaR family protein [Pyrinomonadaceae bacterium]|nr:CdaR family protein [Pyrinomonadaceae bacterium]
MAFRDNKQFAMASDDPWRNLRRLFVSDWGLKLLALAITLVLWFMVSGRISEREIVVEPKPEGRPAASCEVKEVVVNPGKIKMQGPVNRLNEIDKVTLPVSVEGRSESFDVSHLSVPTLDPSVQSLGTVNVHVTIVSTGKPPNTN